MDVQDSLVSWKQSREHFKSASKVCETLHSTKTEKCPPDLAVCSFFNDLVKVSFTDAKAKLSVGVIVLTTRTDDYVAQQRC